MRAIVLGFAATVIASQALAADYLRGSTYEVVKPAFRWDGVYFGGQVGYARSDATFERTPSFDGVLPADFPVRFGARCVCHVHIFICLSNNTMQKIPRRRRRQRMPPP